MKRLITVALGVFVGVAAVPASSSTAPSDAADPVAVEPTAPQSLPAFLGFRAGEERRYILGPPQELYDGEAGSWTIRLVEMLGDPPVGVFALTHGWQLGGGRRELPVGSLVEVESEGELRVNEHGFPLELRFMTKRILAGWGEKAYTVRYRLENRRFVKHIAIDGEDLEHVVAVLSGPDVDLSVPIGIYALIPTGVDCSRAVPTDPRRASRVVLQPRSAGSTGSPASAQAPVRYADNSMCMEQLFGNPGLISLILPSLWEEGTGQHEYVMLTPAGSFGMPGFSGGTGVAGPGGGVSIAGGSSFDHETAVDARTNSRVEDLRYVDRVRVEIGRRTEDAWLFAGIRGLNAVYVDDEGVVLRVDLDPADLYGMSVSGTTAGFDPSRFDTRGLWVRLLYPSEY